MITQLIRWYSGSPAFQVYGKARREPEWRIIDVYATARRDAASRWLLWSGRCICWSAHIIAVGWDFATSVLEDPRVWQITRQNPIHVAGGRLSNTSARSRSGGSSYPTNLEVLAHEIGHTGQAMRLGPLYLPVVGAFTLFGEGPHFWNRFENEASDQGQFGGIVPGSVRRLP